MCNNCTRGWCCTELGIPTAYPLYPSSEFCATFYTKVRSGAVIFSGATLARRDSHFLQHMVRETSFPGEEKPSPVKQTKAWGRAAFPQYFSSPIQQPEQAAMQHKSVLVWGALQSLCNPPAWIAVLYLCQLLSMERRACIWDAFSNVS